MVAPKMVAPLPQLEPEQPPPSSAGGAEYWTMRCMKCGGIHLDIVKSSAPPRAPQNPGDQRV